MSHRLPDVQQLSPPLQPNFRELPSLNLQLEIAYQITTLRKACPGHKYLCVGHLIQDTCFQVRRLDQLNTDHLKGQAHT